MSDHTDLAYIDKLEAENERLRSEYQAARIAKAQFAIDNDRLRKRIAKLEAALHAWQIMDDMSPGTCSQLALERACYEARRLTAEAREGT